MSKKHSEDTLVRKEKRDAKAVRLSRQLKQNIARRKAWRKQKEQ